MAKIDMINFDRGIEGFLPTSENNRKDSLPADTKFLPQGGRVKSNVDAYLEQYGCNIDPLLRLIQPKLSSLSITTPWFYLKYFRSTAHLLSAVKSSNSSLQPEDVQVLDAALSLFETMNDDLQLLSDYVLCLQQV